VTRGQIWDARLDPVEGSEQAGSRPVLIVSRDAINSASSLVVVVPCTTLRDGRHIYPSQIVIGPPEGGLTARSVVLTEQIRALAKHRLITHRGTLSQIVMDQINRALKITLDLP
jgi:mRNA interferase MazF